MLSRLSYYRMGICSRCHIMAQCQIVHSKDSSGIKTGKQYETTSGQTNL